MAERISSPDDLRRAREKALAELDLRSGAKEYRITVHMGTCGIAAGAREVLEGLAGAVEEAGASNVMLGRSGCLGLCDQEPMATVVDRDGNEFRYGRLDRERARRIIREHVLGKGPVAELLV